MWGLKASWVSCNWSWVSFQAFIKKIDLTHSPFLLKHHPQPMDLTGRLLRRRFDLSPREEFLSRLRAAYSHLQKAPRQRKRRELLRKDEEFWRPGTTTPECLVLQLLHDVVGGIMWNEHALKETCFFFQFGVKFASKDWKSREACRPVIWVFLNLKTRLLRVGMW